MATELLDCVRRLFEQRLFKSCAFVCQIAAPEVERRLGRDSSPATVQSLVEIVEIHARALGELRDDNRAAAVYTLLAKLQRKFASVLTGLEKQQQQQQQRQQQQVYPHSEVDVMLMHHLASAGNYAAAMDTAAAAIKRRTGVSETNMRWSLFATNAAPSWTSDEQVPVALLALLMQICLELSMCDEAALVAQVIATRQPLAAEAYPVLVRHGAANTLDTDDTLRNNLNNALPSWLADWILAIRLQHNHGYRDAHGLLQPLATQFPLSHDLQVASAKAAWMAGGGGLAMHLSDSARMPMTTYTAATAIQRQLEDAKRIIDPMSPEIAVLLSEVVFSAAVQGTNVRQSITKLSALAEDFTTWHPQRAVGYIAAARAAWLRALNAGYPGDDNHGKDDAAIAPAVEQAMNAAITLASRALQLEPGSSDALVLRGRLKLDLARITITAEEDRLGPSHPDLDTVLQAVRTELIPAALRDLEAAFKLDHSIVNAAELMGGLCAAGQINRAILMAEELDVTMDDPSECVLVVVAHASIIAADLLQQQSQPNIQQQQQQQADIPLNPRSKRLLASALAKLRTAAQKITSSTSSVNPIAISVLIADALLKLGRHQESLSVLEQAGVATNPIATIARVQSVVHGRIGIISDALGEEIKAIMALTAAVECDPRNTAAKEALEEIVAEQAAQQG